MVYGDPIACPNPECRNQVPWDWAECPVCLSRVKPPNVRWAAAERAELLNLYRQAMDDLSRREAEKVAGLLETAVEQQAKAVIAMKLENAIDLFRKDRNSLYQNYHTQVASGSRLAAKLENDLMRRTVDAQIFGGIASKISMAALSLNGRGLQSYGQVFLELKEIVCTERASLLIDNGFEFVRAHPGGPQGLPPGFRATWQDKGKLAVVKLAVKLQGSTQPAEFSNFLMEATASREHDRFIEVHIYGNWDTQAVACVRGPAGSQDSWEDAQLSQLKNRLENLHIHWESLP